MSYIKVGKLTRKPDMPDMPDISKRAFLFGSVAAVAMAYAQRMQKATEHAELLLPDRKLIIPAPADFSFLRRRIKALTAGRTDSYKAPFREPEGHWSVSLSREGGSPLLQMSLHDRALYRWRAGYGDEIIQPANSVISLDVQQINEHNKYACVLDCAVICPDGREINVMERHSFAYGHRVTVTEAVDEADEEILKHWMEQQTIALQKAVGI